MPLTSIVSGEKLAINCTVIPVFYELFFLSCYFQYFLLVFSSSSLTKLCLYMDLFMFILLEICWLSWFCRVMFLSIVWCFQPLFIQIIFLPFYGTLISHFWYTWYCPTELCLFFFTLFFFLFFTFLWFISRESSLICCWTHLVIFFILVIVLFNSRITISFFL